MKRQVVVARPGDPVRRGRRPNPIQMVGMFPDSVGPTVPTPAPMPAPALVVGRMWGRRYMCCCGGTRGIDLAGVDRCLNSKLVCRMSCNRSGTTTTWWVRCGALFGCTTLDRSVAHTHTLSVARALSFSLSLCLFLCLSVFLSLPLCVCPPVFLSPPLSLCLSLSFSVFLCLSLCRALMCNQETQPWLHAADDSCTS